MFIMNQMTLVLVLGTFFASSAKAIAVDIIPPGRAVANIPAESSAPTLTGTIDSYVLRTLPLKVLNKNGVLTDLSPVVPVIVRDLTFSRIGNTGNQYTVETPDLLGGVLPGVKSYLNFGEQTFKNLGTGILTFDLFGSSLDDPNTPVDETANVFTVSTNSLDLTITPSGNEGLVYGRFVFSKNDTILGAPGTLDVFKVDSTGNYQISMLIAQEEMIFTPIPEPMTILGSTLGLAFLTVFKGIRNKK